MAGFRLFTSNRLEILADKLAEVLASPLSSPLRAEVVVVQSRGMARWLAMEIAARCGICANVRFPFPKAFLEEAFAALSGAAPGTTNPFTPEAMTWKLMGLLPLFLEKPGFEQIRRYLEGEDFHSAPLTGESAETPGDGAAASSLPLRAGLKRFQMAERLAYLFDQYPIFRPEMINAWDQGKTLRREEKWQSALWQALAAGSETPHPVARRDAFLRSLRQSPDSSAHLPERVSLFGVSALPRFHLEILHALAEKIEVNLFLMNPSREFWGEIRSDREQERAVARVSEGRGGDQAPADLYLERGNKLLASLGTLGREFHSLIWEFPARELDFFQDPPADGLLSFIQDDILNLRDRGPEERKVIARQDRSLSFQNCHSPLREVEALYDNLLSLFEAEKGLLPRDILVMAPDIEVYASLIRAVFDKPPGLAPAESSPRLPFTIADRESRAESSLLDGFMRLLDMTGSRSGAAQVLSLLELPEISARFGITPADGELIRRWVTEAGIRWGIDGEDRRRLGLPPRRENTWQGGLERLLMGYALPGKEDRILEGILPYDLEGTETAVLGKLLDFTETFFPLVASLDDLRTLSEWGRFLENMLESLFAPQQEGDRGWINLRGVFLRLQELEEETGFRESVDVMVIKAHLRRHFAAEGLGYGFLAGGVTCCSLLPMRSIPFPVICLLGMNGTAYPRRDWAPAFDLIASHPRPGDRSRRKDDRYLFLEALLSARKRLIISYVGRNSADNAVLPPSVLVTELLDYIEEGFALSGGGDLREHLVTRHFLQAFSPDYFRGREGLFTYGKENWRAARSLQDKQELPPVMPFLPLPAEDWREIDLAALVTFFADPVRFLFQRRLEARFEGLPSLPEDREPFALAGLDKYTLAQRLVERGLAGRYEPDYQDVALASGRLPHGAVGDCHYRALAGQVQTFVGKVQPFLAGKEVSCHEVDLELAGFRLRGNIPLFSRGLVHFRYADLKIKDFLRFWIAHLALHLAGNQTTIPPGILLGRGEGWRFHPPATAAADMARLLAKYEEGMQKPLPLFPLSSWKYGQEVFGNGKSRAEGLQAAARIWYGGEEQPGEGDHPYYRLCFRGRDPLDEEFEDLAAMVLQPLFAAREKI